MKEYIIKIVLCLVIIALGLMFYFSFYSKSSEGTIESLLNLNRNDIVRVTIDEIDYPISKFFAEYWSKPLIESKITIDNKNYSILKGYNSNNELVFTIIIVDDNKYIFDTKEIDKNSFNKYKVYINKVV